MRVLVIGSGGRECALCWKLSQSSLVKEIYCVPGNAGISELAQCEQIEYEKNFSSLTALVKRKKIDFTIVGPEVPLANGIVDYFKKQRLNIFGPKKKASLLEASKVFAKRFMKKYNIPTPGFKVFSNSQKAIEYIKQEKNQKVIKADGLAGGKGSLVTETKEEAIEAVKSIMEKKIFGEAGKRIIVEERIRGEEVSFFVLTDGQTFKPLVSSRDHKRIYDKDKGPNTGGMGAYSPAFIPLHLYRKILKKIVIPTIKGIKNEGIEYEGVLYFGLIVERGNPQVLEFNVRFGDPETQVILPRLKSDLIEVLSAVTQGQLKRITLEWSSHSAVCVILASKGYPGVYEKGKKIEGLEKLSSIKGIIPFFAGVDKKDGQWVTNGGRVMGITSLGKNMKEATSKVYRAINKISFEGMHYRKDIGIPS